MSFDTLERGFAGGFIRICEGLASAAPTLLVGLLIAAILRYYFGNTGIKRFFGGDSLRSMPQSWAIGMLLPVCSLGVIPILVEMRRAKVKPGAMSAFALSAPLFNPLSLLYGVTLSRPFVVLMFAFGSLIVVTIVGAVWDRIAESDRRNSNSKAESEPNEANDDASTDSNKLIGVGRLIAIFTYTTRSLAGPGGGWAIIGMLGVVLLTFVFPFGSLQGSVERDDWWAPATMTLVSVPVYATPMLAMTQLGMMFQHANSPGAAFVLLVLGTGVNFATLIWMGRSFGFRSVIAWFGTLVVIVVSIAYAINKPLVPPGVEPAGHTHAFDVYTNPISSFDKVSWDFIQKKIVDDIDIGEWASLTVLGVMLVGGVIVRLASLNESWLRKRYAVISEEGNVLPSYDRFVSPQVVGGVMICGLIAISVVMCYGYYPPPDETLEDVAVARAECLTAANSGNVEHAGYWLEVWDDLSRRLEVGTLIRKGQLRPYQRMQGYLIRKKLEQLEHELEHDPFEPEETRKVVTSILRTNTRWVDSFRTK